VVEWFLTLFTKTLPREAAQGALDEIVLNGEDSMFRVGAAVVMTIEDSVIVVRTRVEDFVENWTRALKGISERELRNKLAHVLDPPLTNSPQLGQ
jgi:hypothetical protein